EIGLIDFGEGLDQVDSVTFIAAEFCSDGMRIDCDVQNRFRSRLVRKRAVLFSLSLWERAGERACVRQASHPPLTPPKGRGRNHSRFDQLDQTFPKSVPRGWPDSLFFVGRGLTAFGCRGFGVRG